MGSVGLGGVRFWNGLTVGVMACGAHFLEIGSPDKTRVHHPERVENAGFEVFRQGLTRDLLDFSLKQAVAHPGIREPRAGLEMHGGCFTFRQPVRQARRVCKHLPNSDAPQPGVSRFIIHGCIQLEPSGPAELQRGPRHHGFGDRGRLENRFGRNRCLSSHTMNTNPNASDLFGPLDQRERQPWHMKTLQQGLQPLLEVHGAVYRAARLQPSPEPSTAEARTLVQ